jgi:hypothetical protein
MHRVEIKGKRYNELFKKSSAKSDRQQRQGVSIGLERLAQNNISDKILRA